MDGMGTPGLGYPSWHPPLPGSSPLSEFSITKGGGDSEMAGNPPQEGKGPPGNPGIGETAGIPGRSKDSGGVRNHQELQAPWGGSHVGDRRTQSLGTSGWAETPRGARTSGRRVGSRCPKAGTLGQSGDVWVARGTLWGRDMWEKGPVGIRDHLGQGIQDARAGTQGNKAPLGQGPRGVRAHGTRHSPHLEGHLHPVVHPFLQHKGPAPQLLQVSCTGRLSISPVPLPPPPPPPGVPRAHLSGPW